MRTMILLAALAVPSSVPAMVPAGTAAPLPAQTAEAGRSPEQCIRPGIRHAERPRVRIQPRRLDELPPGRLELAVLREVDGCVIPAVVREGIGR